MEKMAGKICLVVDDQETMRQLVSRSLRQLGCEQVLVASNGVTALGILDNQHVDMIISDWNMPNMTGVDLLKAVRANSDTASIPFLMMTAETDRRRVSEVISSGVSGFLIKPFNLKLLQQKIEHSLCVGNPVLMAELERSQAEEVAPSTTGKKDAATLLVVDDTPSNLDVIVNLFRNEYRVKVATSGEQALKICMGAPPDLILLDVMMPGMNGYEVCEKLNENPKTQGIPVIFLTSKGAATDLAKGFDVGGVDYVVKPSDPVVVRTRVRNQLKLKDARDERSQQLDLMVENTRLKEEVQYLMRHDLKTPLVSMLHHLSEMAADTTLEEDNRDRVIFAESAAYRMLAMINGSQDMLKMEKGQYKTKTQKVDIGHLLSKLQREIVGISTEKSVTVTVRHSEAALVTGEELLCYTLLTNLLKNAIEAAPSMTEVSVDTKTVKDEVVVKLSNVGGVPKTIQKNFFDKYVTANKAGGTGLGTYSAKLMVQAQGGTIQLDSADTECTTVCVRLPKWQKEGVSA
ncbi:response regulator [Marinomonas sp. 2405UD68-3]|uniref:response regulator n=1 Tax=Marinomonas sp. 2405UD68-3 TaxID=3391835 RepID=UPI0039C9054F